MAKLWFQNCNGEERVIADCANWFGVCNAINNFIDSCNAAKPADNQFKSYYMRAWDEDGRTKIDVGSWDEFFYWEGRIAAMDMKKDGEVEFEYE